MAVVKSADRALWETSLTARIQRRIDELTREHGQLFDEVRRRAREQAVVELGLAELEATGQRLREERAELDRRQRQLEREQLAVLRRCAPADVPDADLSLTQQLVTAAISRQTDLCEPDLLAEHAPGRELLELEEERERLLETIMLATTASELQALWQQLSLRLNEQATPLQRFALGLEDQTS